MSRKSLLLYFLFFLPGTVLFAQQLSPAVIWQKCLGGSGDDKANSIVQTADGGFVIAGSTTSNNGDVAGHHGSADSTDGWIVKISATGSVEWQLSLGGTGSDVFNSVLRLTDGNFLCMGTSTSTDGDVTGNHGSADWWVVKVSPYGAVIWNKCYGGSMPEFAGNMKENKDGSLFLTGSTMSYDGNVTGHHGTGFYDQDIWVVKLNGDGSMIREHCFGGSGDDVGYDINESDNGSFILGITTASIDGDFGNIGELSPRGAITKIDSGNNVVWTTGIPASKPIALIPTGNIYDVNTDVLGCIPNLNNFAATQYQFQDLPSSTTAPVLTSTSTYTYCVTGGSDITFLQGYKATGSSGIARISAADHLFAGSSDDSLTHSGFHGGLFDGFISGYKTNTGISYEKFLGGTGDDEFNSVTTIDPYNYIIAGFTNSNDGDVSGNHGGYDVWIVKMGRVNTIKGIVYQDYNHNNAKDPGEPLINNFIVQSQKGIAKSASSTYNGFFDNAIDTGTYSTAVLTNLPYYTASPASKTSVFNTYNNTDSFSFALQPVPDSRDYSIYIWNYSEPQPGFQSQYKLVITNKGTDTLTHKKLSLLMDNRMQYVSSAPAQTAVSGDTITWMLNSLSPRDTTSITVVLQSGIPPLLNFNDTLMLSATIDSSGDLYPLDNTSTIYQVLQGSYDPNSKEEIHGGSIGLTDVSSGKDLLYTIRFQNTGNDTAYTVVIRDTLENGIAASSIEMVAASHPYTLTIQDSSALTWTFSHILLADSTHNEPESHGYIAYRVKPRNNLITGDIIKNTASAYFDFNPPVQTNIQTTIVKKPLPIFSAPVLSALDSVFCSSSGNEQVKILNLPSASSHIHVTVLLDAVLPLPVATDSTFTIVTDNLDEGNHSVAVAYTDSSGQSKSTTLHFTIHLNSIPSFTLSANHTTTGSGPDPIVIIATAMVGNGQTTLFTFAQDSGFQNILQPESSSNSLSLQPGSLFIGDQWIYVKMRVTNPCQSTQSVIDSIKITRGNTTGFIDPDFPGRPINAFPNPFDNLITVTGLSILKQYELQMYTASGSRLLDRRFTSQQTVNVNEPFIAKGVYTLRIYDLTKNRLIGTFKMLKQ